MVFYLSQITKIIILLGYPHIQQRAKVESGSRLMEEWQIMLLMYQERFERLSGIKSGVHEDDMKYTLLQETITDLEFGSAMMDTNDGLRELRNPYRAVVGKKNFTIVDYIHFRKVMNWTDFPDELV